MDIFTRIIEWLEWVVWNWGIPVGDQTIPFIVIALLGTGIFLTLRLGFIQVRHLAHGFGVTSGKYDDPNEPGDVSHFQALTTALSATVGIGNIAGVALAIHFGGPGALFWMWMTAFLGMAVKYSEVTLAQHFRQVEFDDPDPNAWDGSVSGGPMYYIEKGLGAKWKALGKPVAAFFAGAMILVSFLTGNAVQANTVADIVHSNFGIAPWITGLLAAILVGAVILGGIRRIGKVTGILAPVMATIYVLGALIILVLNASHILPTFGLIFREAFNPSAGIAGTGTGAILLTMMWGVRRGLFSNEAGQGSAPIAHAAAKTDEPVSEGVVALLEPFIDTLVICTMTGLAILITGVWDDRIPTRLELAGGDASYIASSGEPTAFEVIAGEPQGNTGLAWHEVVVDNFYLDEDLTQPFTGSIDPLSGTASDLSGGTFEALWGPAVESSAPLTQLAFKKGLSPLGDWGGLIVLVSVLLFGISTAISWSYYGDRSANYLFGKRAILPYKVVFIIAHFLGAVVALPTVWKLGDIALGIVTFPNLVALVVLSGLVVKLTKSYFERKPWEANALAHKKWLDEQKGKES